MPENGTSHDSTTERVPGVPGQLSFVGLLAAAARLCALKPLQLVAAFVIVYGIGLGLSYAASPLEGTATVVAALAIRVLVSIAAAFATAFVSILLADAAVGRDTQRGSAAAVLKVHARELTTAGLLAVVIAFPLEYLLPYITYALVGPPLVAHVIALEYRSFRESLARTGELVRGQWARVVLVIFGFVLIVLVVFYTFVIYGLPVIVPFYSAGMLALYLDVRARAEGLDAETFAEERQLAMDERPVAGSSPG